MRFAVRRMASKISSLDYTLEQRGDVGALELLALLGDLRGVFLRERFAFGEERRVFGFQCFHAQRSPAVVVELRELTERVGGAEGHGDAADGVADLAAHFAGDGFAKSLGEPTREAFEDLRRHADPDRGHELDDGFPVEFDPALAADAIDHLGLHGHDVEFTVDAFPYLPFRGKVAQVRNAPITVQNVVTYDTVIEVNNAESKLKPGMTANVSISIAQRQGVLKIPNAALRFRPPDSTKGEASAKAAGSGEKRRGGDGAAPRERAPSLTRTVYVLRGDQPEPVQVKLGISDGIATEALDGLNENDLLVTGMVMPQPSTPAQPSTNPLGGGSGRRF